MNKFNRAFTGLFLGSIVGLCFGAFVAFAVSSCGHKVSPYAADSLLTGKDSTLYGVAGECGMSTFCLVVDSGEPIYVTRDNEAGQYGDILGELNEGDSFSLSTRDNGEVLVRAINLTGLSRFPITYRIFNGHFVLDNHVATIDKFDKDSLVVVYSDGSRVGFAAKK
ncbi:MAG: hypothetical protein RR386_00885 [Bacteroidaceae bacterium]